MSIRAWAAALIWLGAGQAMAQGAEGPVIYEGGQVWTGQGFSAGAVAVRDGRIVSMEDIGPAARRVSVAGQFVVPAYANAHAHVTNATTEASRFFTDNGVYYVWNPNTVIIGPQGRAFYERPDVYDVKSAQGGITEPGGHPERLYVQYLAQSVYAGRDKDWFIGNAFHYGETPAQIDAALDLLVRQGAQLVKIYLLNSERYAVLKDDPKAYGQRGLNPENVAYLVTQAHARGLPVAAHVETAHDLEVAARAGVDVAAHLPGYGGASPEDLAARRLTPEIARLVASAKMKVVPTYGLIRGSAYEEGAALPKPGAEAQVEVQVENLRLLKAAGVQVLIGTDGFGPIWGEVEHLVQIGAFSDAEATGLLLSTGAALFPERQVGCLRAGCEADFLVLAADPTAGVAALRRIERRVMQGVELAGPEAAKP